MESSNPSSSRDLAHRAVARLRRAGHSAYLVGGCVRDLLLGRKPTDYDVATSAPPEQLTVLFPGAQLVGAHFGVVLVREGEADLEVATYRTEHDYSDGRHPSEVRFETDPRADVGRRDFTVNALMMDPETGEVLDYVGGRQDLAEGVIRAVGDPERRFAEDHLRLLRAVRFASRLGFEIEPSTFAAIRKLAPLVLSVSAERTRDEIARILVEGNARRGVALADSCGLLEHILPEIAAMKGVAQPAEFHPEGDVWTHTLLMLSMMERPTLTLALGVLLHDVGKPPTFQIADRIRFNGHAELGAKMGVEILGRLRFSGDEIRRVEALVAHHLRFKDVRQMRESTLKRFVRMDGFEEHLELHRLDCMSSHRMLDNYHFVAAKLRETPPADLRPAALVTGRDLIALGFQPGPAFRGILEAVETGQLEGRLGTAEEALEFVRATYSRPSGEPIAAP